jgi:integrase/recombinase XerD
LRVSELVALDRKQFDGKNFADVRRKGKVRTAKCFVPPEAREALERYLEREWNPEHPALFQSRRGERLGRQHIDRALRLLAAQANARLAEKDHIVISPHVLRHTFLRKVTQKHGVEFAMETAGHASSKYIWRYVRPCEEQKEEALKALF